MQSLESLCDIPVPIRDKLEKVNICTVEDFCARSSLDLQITADLTEAECNAVNKHIIGTIAPSHFYSAFELQNNAAKHWQFLSTGSKVLDKFLGGGYARRGITEIFGESGTGKTQLCIQAALTVQLDERYGGLNSGAVYICTEDRFPSSRLSQLLRPWAEKFSYEDSGSSFSDNIYIQHIPSAESLKQCILVNLPNFLLNKRIGLVVIDSIAGAFRADYDEFEAVQRAKEFREMAAKLYKLAKHYHLAVICVNQVTAIPSDSETVSEINPVSSMTEIVPALGLAWANIVTVRLQLHRSDSMIPNPNESGASLNKRFLEVVFSPYLPREKCQFVVTQFGIQGETEPFM